MPDVPLNEGYEIETRVLECSAYAFRAAYSVLQNYADAEDITQDTLVKAIQSLSQLREIDCIQSWVARIGWRLALNKLRVDRSRLRREALTYRKAGGASSGIDHVVMNDTCHRLRMAINGLPPQYRAVAVLVGI